MMRPDQPTSEFGYTINDIDHFDAPLFNELTRRDPDELLHELLQSSSKPTRQVALCEMFAKKTDKLYGKKKAFAARSLVSIIVQVEGDPRVRSAVVNVMSEFRECWVEIVPQLCKATVETTHEIIRLAAVRALGSVCRGAQYAIPVVVSLFSSSFQGSRSLRSIAAETLLAFLCETPAMSGLTPEHIDTICKTLYNVLRNKEETNDIRCVAANGLGAAASLGMSQSMTREVLIAIEQVVTIEVADVQNDSLAALANFGPRAIPLLCQLICHSDPNTANRMLVWWASNIGRLSSDNIADFPENEEYEQTLFEKLDSENARYRDAATTILENNLMLANRMLARRYDSIGKRYSSFAILQKLVRNFGHKKSGQSASWDGNTSPVSVDRQTEKGKMGDHTNQETSRPKMHPLTRFSDLVGKHHKDLKAFYWIGLMFLGKKAHSIADVRRHIKIDQKVIPDKFKFTSQNLRRIVKTLEDDFFYVVLNGRPVELLKLRHGAHRGEKILSSDGEEAWYAIRDLYWPDGNNPGFETNGHLRP